MIREEAEDLPSTNRRINLQVVTSPTSSQTVLSPSGQDITAAAAAATVMQGATLPQGSIEESEEQKIMLVSLHDREDDKKNLNVSQEVSEVRQGGFKHINTTNKMEMFNSTIMKIVVT